ncbi:MAG: hypothetical protein SFU86_09255, partial [Pirellulaceae bacterium]|nr:hypothetical protein [Pirellulaceae bacterium]
GHTPAPAGSAAEKLLWHQAVAAAPLSRENPAITPRLESLVARMMAKQAADRPQSLDEIAEELDGCLADLPDDAPLALEGVEFPPDEPSTVQGSRPGKHTMLNPRDTATIVGPAPRKPLAAPPPAEVPSAPARGKWIAYGAGALGLCALAALAAAPFLAGPPAPRPGIAQGNNPPAAVPKPPAVNPPDVNPLPVPTPLPTARPQPHQEVLAWVLQNRGKVRVQTGGGQAQVLTTLAEVPDQPVEILAIDLAGTGAHDRELALLANVPGLRELNLADTKITDEGLAHLAVLKELTHLNLSQTKVKNAGLEHLERLSKLVELDLSHTQISDQGLARLRGLSQLERLVLSDTSITDAGIGQLKGLTALTNLWLHNTGLSETEHAALVAALPNLRIAWDGADEQRKIAQRLLEKGGVLTVADKDGQLHAGIKSRDGLPIGRIVIKAIDLAAGVGIVDADLAQLVALPEIESLRLANLPLSAASLAPLQGLASLKSIDLGASRLPAAALEALQKALPDCKLLVVTPPDAEVAAAVLKAGGKVSLKGERNEDLGDFADATRLPTGMFSVRAIQLDNLPDVGDELLARWPELATLEVASLAGTGITDEGVTQLAACRSLRELGLSETKITASGVAALARLPALARLYLAETKIGSEGVRHVAALDGLTHLSLRKVELADNDLALLKRLERLEWLDVSHTALTDAALVHLSLLGRLRYLNVEGTGLTDLAVEELQAMLGGPGREIVADAPDRQRLAARWVLQNKGYVALDAGPLKSPRDLPRDACRIVVLDLRDIPALKTSDLVKHLAGCTDLAVLHLDDAPLREADLAALGGLSSLRELYLPGLSLTDAGLKHLAALDKLEVLDLSRTMVTGRGLAELSRASGLKQLLLANAQFDEQFFPLVTAFTGLETLDLSSSPRVTDEGLAHLDKLHNLRWLSLRRAKLTNSSLERIAKLAKLASLNLDETTVGDDGLAKLAGLANLADLSLAKTPITEGSVATLGKLKSLRSLSLVGTSLTPSALQQLQTALPQCTIKRPAPPPRDPNNPSTFGPGGAGTGTRPPS